MENIEQKKKRKLSRKTVYLLGAIALLVIGFGIKTIYHASTHESTDNAQVDGNIIPLKTTVTGFIKEIYFTDNQQVKRGDTLITFDTTDLAAQVRQAEAQLFATQTGLALSKEQVVAGQFNQNAAGFTSGSVKENTDAAKAKVWEIETNYNRIANMFSQGAATQQALDNAKTSLSIAKAQLAALEKQYQSTDAQKQTTGAQVNIYNLQTKADEARIKQALAQLTLARNQLSHAFVTTPCDGIVSKKNVEVGQFVSAGSPMASIINLKEIWVTANFKEIQLKDMLPGQPVEIKIDAYPRLLLKGTVQSFCAATGVKFSILPAENATGNFIKVTQRVPVRISIRQGSSEKMLLPGMNVEVDVKTN
jgi:membrane fusion protein (multidrug efflux system)